MNPTEVIPLTDEERAEFQTLQNSEAVKLAKSVLRERYKERQMLYKLRSFHKLGEALMKDLAIERK